MTGALGMSERPMRLNLDRLVVHGMPPAHAKALGPLVQRELQRLVAEGGVPAHLANGGRVPALPGLRAAPGAPPHMVAAQVARAVYGAMGGGTASRDGNAKTEGGS
ncbi:MAG TPA: hypothetical protein VFT45_12025 [Longimicrobium sp.]|nr:hypothetical protein [Longimicrobium sp.]